MSNTFLTARFTPYLLFALMACSEPDAPADEIQLTGEALLASHTWQSDRYVFRGSEYSTFHWDCEFYEDIEGYKAGDFGRLESQIELSFSKEGFYRRIVTLSTYQKCSSCTEYSLVHTSKDTLAAFYYPFEDKIYFGTKSHPAQFFHFVEYTNNNEIRLLEFYNVFEVDRESVCYFNGNELASNRSYRLDVIFRPKKN